MKTQEKYVKFIFSILNLCLTFICVSCQNEQISKKYPSQILRVNNQGDVSSIHPHLGSDLYCRIFQKALFEGLTRINLEGNPELAGAEHVEISPCKKIYIFTLRPMLWTNGEKVTAFQFERSWKEAISPESECPRADLFYPIKNAEKIKKKELPLEELKIQALDDVTFVVELEHPTPYFLDLISNPLFSPLYNDDKNPTIFNGPFKISSWRHEEELVLCKNPDYWDANSVKLDAIYVSQVHDANTALLMYEKNELNWIGHPFTNLPQDSIEEAEKHPDFNSKPIAGVYWISLNTNLFPLNSINLRKALSIALDRKSISKHVLLGETPTKSIVPIGISLFNEEELYSDNNASLAQRHFNEGLKELGLTLENFPPLVLEYSDVPGQKKLAEAIQENWHSIFGIKIEIIGSEWNVFAAQMNHKQFHIGGCVWFSSFYDPICTLNFFRSRSHCYNASDWENSGYEKLLRLADEELDSALRLEHLKEAETILLDEMPIIPLFVYHSKYLKSNNLKNLAVNELGYVDFKWAYFE